MRLSICIPTHDGRCTHLKEAIDSILAQWRSAYTGEVQICVSDNGSRDGTWPMLLDYARRCPGLFELHRFDTDQGGCVNFLRVVEMARGEWAWMLGSDDAFEPGAIEAGLDAARCNPDATGICVNRLPFDRDLATEIPEIPHIHPVDADRSHSYGDADAIICELGIWQNYISGCIFKRQCWNDVVEREGAETIVSYRHCSHSYVFACMTVNRPRWAWAPDKIVRYRSRNASYESSDRTYGRFAAEFNDDMRRELRDTVGERSRGYRKCMRTLYENWRSPTQLRGWRADKAHNSADDWYMRSVFTKVARFEPRFWLTTFPQFLVPHQAYKLRVALGLGTRLRRLLSPAAPGSRELAFASVGNAASPATVKSSAGRQPPARADRRHRPVAIVGAGRSGTSMLVRMLGYSGLSLGDGAEFKPADEHNTRGYWEHAELFDLNERLTAFLGGCEYDEPPRLGPGWHLSQDLEPLYEEANDLVDRSLESDRAWVWKLPQASVTIPFWRTVVPGLRFIICVRNPLDYAASIQRAHSISRQHALALWALYNIAALSDTPPGDRFVTSFEEYFPDYRPGLMPVLDFLGMEAHDSNSDVAKQIRNYHDSSLRHLGSTAIDLLADPDAPHIVKELYIQIIQSGRNAEGVLSAVHHEESMQLLQMTVAAEASAVRETRELARIAAERDHLKQILESRTHRAASSICAAAITLKSLGKPRSVSSGSTGIEQAPDSTAHHQNGKRPVGEASGSNPDQGRAAGRVAHPLDEADVP